MFRLQKATLQGFKHSFITVILKEPYVNDFCGQMLLHHKGMEIPQFHCHWKGPSKQCKYLDSLQSVVGSPHRISEHFAELVPFFLGDRKLERSDKCCEIG